MELKYLHFSVASSVVSTQTLQGRELDGTEFRDCHGCLGCSPIWTSNDFFQHLWPYIGNNTANVVFQMVKRLWLIHIANDFT
ncbi:hypothetical protein TNCV_1157341 [Trichonephila clavipes]|nr:hypothetical protein TNCV_1157341 [Trichonephila clavipes]